MFNMALDIGKLASEIDEIEDTLSCSVPDLPGLGPHMGPVVSHASIHGCRDGWLCFAHHIAYLRGATSGGVGYPFEYLGIGKPAECRKCGNVFDDPYAYMHVTRLGED
jgi:hypothetical protein